MFGSCITCPSLPQRSANHTLASDVISFDHRIPGIRRPQVSFNSDLFHPSIIPLPGTWQGHYASSYLPTNFIPRISPLYGKHPKVKTALDLSKSVAAEESPESKEKQLVVIEPITKSSDLKFGIDRILHNSSEESNDKKKSEVSEDVSPRAAFHHYECQPTLCQCHHPRSARIGLSSLYYNRAQCTVSLSNRTRQDNSSHRAADFPGPYSVLSSDHKMNHTHNAKRKRSWSRAVFSNLQRKGLEKRFEVQKYVTKPDRRQLAAMLGLTDAQVKVWFQNRRMKWRHEMKKKNQDEGQAPTNGNTEHDHVNGEMNNSADDVTICEKEDLQTSDSESEESVDEELEITCEETDEIGV